MAQRGIPGSGVRPTQRCLIDDLRLAIPDLGVVFEHIDHDLVVKAQRVPSEVASGGSERILALDDRVWLKVKTEVWRGAVTAVDDEGTEATTRWWLGAAGERQGDSAHRDFYEHIRSECARARAQANSATGGRVRTEVSSEHLLPTLWDRDRLEAELAYQALRETQRLICRMAAESMRTMRVICFDLNGHEVRVFVRAKHEDAYIAISAAGIVNPNVYVMLLGAIPGISVDDWMPEPGGHSEFNLTPREGEILWSAVLPPSVAAKLLEVDDGAEHDMPQEG